MTMHRNFFLAFSLVAAAGLSATAAQAQNTVLKLDYGSGICEFNTPGISINSSNPGIITASGTFNAASCPSGGGATGDANLLFFTASPTPIETGGTTNIKWSATADVCSYDGSMLPGAVPGWQSSGMACIGSSACAAGQNINPQLTAGGAYNFKLNCISGAHGNDPQTQDTDTVTVQVNGAQSNDTCVAPAGLTRATTGAISSSSGANGKVVNVEQWDNVFGYSLAGNYTQPWPGPTNNEAKMTIKKNQYWSLKFKVPSTYPLYGTAGWDNKPGPFGTFSTNETNTDDGVLWTVSITKSCGEFFAPASGPQKQCYAEYTNSASYALLWAVVPQGQYAPSNMCSLNPGETYYLNIIPAPLGDPNNISGNGCNLNQCRNNFSSFGNFSGTQGL